MGLGQVAKHVQPSLPSPPLALPSSPIQTASCSAVPLAAGSSQLVNLCRADVPRQASLDLRDEMKQFGRRLTCGGKKAANRTARPGRPSGRFGL
ncbi:hypothetical protein L3Q82_000824 [Scortum barcoo]|uniref:Uncharacterized protein n=1 Tax=Scortum barcoo TaxID=214431 RepID=A0ACB8WEE3_9TELE|nr:hypothetical protein L3Q82_000824 [Scortum barcoo]